MGKTPVRVVLAQNLELLKKQSSDLNTQEKIAKRAKVSQTSISQMLRPDNPTAESPKLSQVEKVANAFGLSTWQLLLDQQTVGKSLFDLLMRPTVGDDDKRLDGWKAPRSKQTTVNS